MAGDVGLKVVAAPNAFKGTLSAAVAAAAMGRGARRVWPAAEVREVPLSDGGDGFTATVVQALNGRIAPHPAEGALGDSHPAQIGWIDSGRTAVVDLASACGLAGIATPDAFTARTASSKGLGTLIAAALASHPDRIIAGLGGSASTDGGTGMLTALGYRFLDRNGQDLEPGGSALRRLRHVEPPAVSLPEVEILIACDVSAPLLGPAGSAATFAAQKGADPDTIAELEAGLERLAEVVEADLGAVGVRLRPGAGAAGGCGFGLALIGGRLGRGSELVADLVGIDHILTGATLAITGEGRADATSGLGKVTGEVARRAAARGVPCYVIAGSASEDAPALLAGLGARLTLLNGGTRAGDSAGAVEHCTVEICQGFATGPPPRLQ